MSNINLDNLYVCSVVDKKNTSPSDHCFDQCGHAEPHEKDDCTKEEVCELHSSGRKIKVKCRKLNKKEKALLLNQNL